MLSQPIALAERLAASLATLSTLPEVSAEAPLGGW